MRITWTTFAHPFTSAGVIANNVIVQLSKLGIDVDYNTLNEVNNIEDFPPAVQKSIQKGFNPDSINIFFSYPDIYSHHRAKINVGYTGYDSTKGYKTDGLLRPHEIINDFMDYMLTPSVYSKNNMISCGVNIPTDIFPHGIDPKIFNLVKKASSKPFTFSYCGELSRRKGSQDLIKSFGHLFGNDQDFKLVLRANTHMMHYDGEEIKKLCERYNNIELIWKDKGQEEIKDYYTFSDCYCYPSKADWFGLTVFESLAVGIPTIANSTNGYYEFLKDFIIPIDHYEEEIENNHPWLQGSWFPVDKIDLKRKMRYVVENYEKEKQRSYDASYYIHENFSWEQVTNKYLVPFLDKVWLKHFEGEKKVFDMKNEDQINRVTIGIPTKDRPVELALLLQSLMFQTYQNFDVLIINDSVTDVLETNTTIRGLIKVLEQSDHEVIIIKGEIRGPHIAGQKILDNAKTELILRLDDDISLRPIFIEELVNVIKDEKVGAVGPIYLNPNEPIDTQVMNPEIKKEEIEDTMKVFWTGKELYLNGWAQINLHSTSEVKKAQHLNAGFMYRRSAGRKIGGYFLDFSPVGHREESDFTYRIFREGYELYIVPNAVGFHFHPMTGGIRETRGEYLKKINWDHDEKLFLDRIEQWLPRDKKLQEDIYTSVIILCHGDKTGVHNLLNDIYEYTNHPYEITIICNETKEDYFNNKIIIRDKARQTIYVTESDLSVSEARNFGAKVSDPKSKFICFIDDDARILGRYNQVTDWIDYLYNRFHEENDVGAVGPIHTWFDPLKTHCLSVACLFTSRKVWEVIGGFDPVFGNLSKETFGWEDVDWSYRCVSAGFKLLGVKGLEFPFYHQDTTEKIKTLEREKALIKGRELLMSKYNINEINMFYNRTIYPLTPEQIEIQGTKINVGSYYMYLDGFINVDINKDVNPDLLANGKDLDKHFKPNSVKLILASQVLEHFEIEDAKKALSVWYNLLEPSGILIVEVPECSDLDERVKKGDMNEHQAYVCRNGNLSEFGQQHKVQFTKETLHSLLLETGFKSNNINQNLNTSDGNNPLAIRFDCRK